MAKFDYDGAVAKAGEAAKNFVVIGHWVSFYEIYFQMRGLEQAMMDLALDPDYVDAVLDRIEMIQAEMMRRFLARTGKTVDLVFSSDDSAGQTGLLMSPEMWGRHLLPPLENILALVETVQCERRGW